MAYTKVGPFVNGAAPALNAANMDTIETQYDEAAADLVTHAALTTGTHGVGGGTIAEVADIVATKLDDFTTPDDNTDLDSSTTEHGLLRKLDNVVTNFLNGQGGWSVPVSAEVTVAETEVFASGAAPTSWTDLDISGVVGSNVALVILKISQSSTADDAVAVRKNGDTDEYYGGAGINMGAAQAHVIQNTFAILVVVTDSSGILEWRAQSGATYTVDVIAFVKPL